jgi:hypothetical protein
VLFVSVTVAVPILLLRYWKTLRRVAHISSG